MSRVDTAGAGDLGRSVRKGTRLQELCSPESKVLTPSLADWQVPAVGLQIADEFGARW